jgi:hypothetical protein
MFHFPTFPPHALCVQARVTPHDWCGVPPFGHPRINARLAAPRGLSQPPTSFIGSWCPGIHRVPLTTWPHKHPRPPTTQETRAQPPPEGDDQTQNSLVVDQRRYPDTYLQDTTTPNGAVCIDARVHCAVLNVRAVTPHPPPPDPGNPGGTTSMRHHRRNTPTPPARSGHGRPVPSGPNSVPTTSPSNHHVPHPPRRAGRTSSDHEVTSRTGQRSTLELHPEHPRASIMPL